MTGEAPSEEEQALAWAQADRGYISSTLLSHVLLALAAERAALRADKDGLLHELGAAVERADRAEAALENVRGWLQEIAVVDETGDYINPQSARRAESALRVIAGVLP